MAFMHLAGGIDLSAQEIIQLPAEDEWLAADFEEVYRVGSVAGEDWEQFAKIVSLGLTVLATSTYSTDRRHVSSSWLRTAAGSASTGGRGTAPGSSVPPTRSRSWPTGTQWSSTGSTVHSTSSTRVGRLSGPYACREVHS